MSTTTKTKKIKVRGTGCYDPETKQFGFEPFNVGESSQANVKSCKGGGKSWETVGSDPSKMICLKTKMSSPDPYSDFVSQFNALTKDLRAKKTAVALPDSQRVVSEQGLECWLDEQKGKVSFTGTIDLTRHCRDWQAEVLRQVQLVVRRLPANEKFNQVINQIKKQGVQNHV